MLKSFIWPGFVALVIAQWLVPGQMIWSKEKILTQGIQYKFQSAPVDPNDPFRGRYVVLNFKESSYKVAGDKYLNYGTRIYVSFYTDNKGFAKIEAISETRPERPGYIETTVSYVSRENDTTTIGIDYPFNTFYLEEYKAPEAERIYGESVIDSTQRTYALVSILNGDAVVKDIFINDTSIHEIIRKRNAIR